jgi:hypothetical protein
VLSFFVNPCHFISCRAQRYLFLLFVVLAVQFSVPCKPYLQKDLSDCFGRLAHPQTWVVRVAWLSDLVILCYANFPMERYAATEKVSAADVALVDEGFIY